MKLKYFIILACIGLVSCGKKSSNETSTSRKATSELSMSQAAHKITRRYDINSIHDYYNESYISNYTSNLNNKDLEVTLASDETLDQAGCYTDDHKLGTIKTFATPESKSFRINISFQQSLAPLFVYCPVERIGSGIKIKEFRILPDIYVTDENKEQFINWANEKITFDHVVFNLNETYFIKNRDLTIKANKFVNLKKVTIANFSENDTAPNDQDGLSGGIISLTAKEAVGELLFKLNGQNGGEVTFVPKMQTKTHKEDPSLNGSCTRSGKNCNGRPGKAGYPGLQGFTGKNGGDSGALQLKIDKSLGLYFYIHKKEGQGSLGGKGGAGGVGQPGGYHDFYVPPKIDCGALCIKPLIFDEVSRKYGRAPSGPNGPQGERGQSGNNGKVKESNLTIEDVKVREITETYENFFGDRL